MSRRLFSVLANKPRFRKFDLERYFAIHEFTAKHLLCCSDGEALLQQEVLDMADAETRSLWNNLSLQYTEVQGHPLLTREIANRYQNGSPDDILVLTPQEGILIAMERLLSPGDHIVSILPAYQSLFENALAKTCEVDFWKPNIITGTEGCLEWNFNIQELHTLIKPNTRMLVVNFPHNPTGWVPKLSELEEICNLCESKGVILFCDEMYAPLYYRERIPSVYDLYDNAVVLSGLSKSFGCPGLRIGWLALKNKDFMRAFLEMKDYTTICSSAPSEILGISVLRNCKVIFDRLEKIVKHNETLLQEFCKRNSGLFTFLPALGGTTSLIRLEGEAKDMGGYEFCELLVKESGVMLIPSTMFCFDDGYVRFGLGRKDFPSALCALEEFLTSRFRK